MLKRIFALIPLSVLVAAMTSMTAYAVSGETDVMEGSDAVALVAVLLSVGVIVAFTVMSLMKKRKAK